MNVLNNAKEQQSQEDEFTYEYTEITDLCLPKLTAEEKQQVIELVNQIERLKVSIHERQQRKVVVPDAELNNLNKMTKEFRRITKSSLFGQLELATRGRKIKFKGALAETNQCDFINDIGLGKSILDKSKETKAKVAGVATATGIVIGIGALTAGSSAATMTGGLATLGGIVGGGMAAGIAVTAAAPLAIGGLAYLAVKNKK